VITRLSRPSRSAISARGSPLTPARPAAPAAPPGFTARADIGRQLGGLNSSAGLLAREHRIAAQDPELVARQRLRHTGADGQLAV
jgi:hypothetical protein